MTPTPSRLEELRAIAEKQLSLKPYDSELAVSISKDLASGVLAMYDLLQRRGEALESLIHDLELQLDTAKSNEEFHLGLGNLKEADIHRGKQQLLTERIRRARTAYEDSK